MTDAPAKAGERGKPILFSAPMVKALIAGTKTQTRRIIKPQPDDLYEGQIPAQLRIGIGNHLWVREAWRTSSWDDHWAPSELSPSVTAWRYEADGVVSHDDITSFGRLRPSIHMPRWASRLTLIVTGVRVQRLQDISNDDCIAEGVPAHPNPNAPRTGPAIDAFAREHGLISHYGAEYRRIWNAINGAGSWAANPWIAAYSFEVHHQNIDALPLPAARDAAMKEGG